MYALIVVILNSIFDLRAFNIYSICVDGTDAQQPNVILTLFLILLPLMIMISVTCIMDFTCLVWLMSRRAVQPDTEDTAAVGCITIIDEIPLRATVINTLLLMPYLITSIALSRGDINPLEKYLIAILSYRFNDVIRSPLIATCTFKINNENMRRSRARQREINRQKEIQSALVKRRERKLLKSEMIEMEDFTTGVSLTDSVIERHPQYHNVPQIPQVPQPQQVPNTLQANTGRTQILEAHVRIVLSHEGTSTPQNITLVPQPTSTSNTGTPEAQTPSIPNSNATVFFIQLKELPKVDC